jgi:sulfotransferase family protein
VIARIARRAGYNLGSNLNSAEDALEFYSFHDRWINRFVWAGDGNRALTDSEAGEMERDFQSALGRHLPAATREAPGTRWGWKAPRSIYLLPFLITQFERLKFIHVLRDGRDMALSPNQNQLRKHGRAVLSWKERLFNPLPERSLLLWHRVNRRAAEYGEENMGQNYLRIRFEDLCSQPVETTAKILLFLGVQMDPEPLARTEISSPLTIGRWQTCPPQMIARFKAIAAVSLRKFGYSD